MGTVIMIIAIIALSIATVERHIKTKQLKRYLEVANNTAHASNLCLIDTREELKKEKEYSGKIMKHLEQSREDMVLLLKTQKK